jgi:hypothetical protein
MEREQEFCLDMLESLNYSTQLFTGSQSCKEEADGKSISILIELREITAFICCKKLQNCYQFIKL